MTRLPVRPGMLLALCLLVVVCVPLVTPAQTTDWLPSWHDRPAKAAIVAFVRAVTDRGSKDFVPPAERIAVFDNDGTLWAEQPMYFQLAFAMDRVRAMAPGRPEWKTKQPFKGVLDGDMKAVLASGQKGLFDLIVTTHSGMSTEEFEKIAAEWIATARHPRFKRAYTEIVYLPMLELLAYLREHGFKAYIVSGGGVDFMRAWTERVYGIPPEQVIGSTIVTEFQLRSDRGPVLMRQPKLDFIDDGPGKPVSINKFIGRRPILAFGNSDGDHQMLQWTAAGSGLRFVGLVHHTDGEREWAYDRQSRIGRLDRALDEALARNWTVVSMRTDWKKVFAFE